MKIAVIAGEKSGDNYGALLIESIKKIEPSVSIIGTGGEGIKEKTDLFIEGIPSGQMGFSGVISRLPLFYHAFKKVKRTIEKENPSFIVFIDNPGFNLKLAEVLGEQFPCFYYIPPKVWAHQYHRIKIIKKYIRAVITIFPFEKEVFQKEGIPSFWFGHPVKDLVKDVSGFEVKDNIPVVGLLPGSRYEEVKYLLPVFLNLVKNVSKRRNIRAFISSSDKNIKKLEEKILRRQKVDMEIVEGSPHSLIVSSSLLLAASGTVNLEVALLQKPMLVFYKTTYINYLVARLMVKLDMISPVNLILNEKVVPEYVQKFSYSKILSDMEEILDRGDLYRREKEAFERLKCMLGEGNVSEKVAGFLIKRI